MQPAELLTAVLFALDNLVTFYESSYDGINLDGLYGLRVIEGQLTIVSGLTSDSDLSNRLLRMSRRSHKCAERAIPFVRENDAKYFEQMQWLIDKPWLGSGPMKTVDTSLSWQNASKWGEFSETQSDACFNSLIRTCNASRDCLDLMVGLKPSRDYILQHQILFVEVAQLLSCTLQRTNENALKEEREMTENIDLNHMLHVLCSNSYVQLQEMVRERAVYRMGRRQQDLVMETIFACGHVGYFEFAMLKLLPVSACFLRDNVGRCELLWMVFRI